MCTVLAGIYSGAIRDWDAAPIAALNPGIKLPHQPIVPVRRSDASGDTYIFTQFLSFADLDSVHFIALPAQIFAKSEAQILNIK
ncbi:MAG: substrate-binding domain-containing protein [Verrucomicrobia bacterium]|nr:substrate-binding domain-containing protein [Verrucomicrobiota bacterium]MBV8486434.1 substrate-binding domain-containing protein [Verrucomicrobiota bacterium]